MVDFFLCLIFRPLKLINLEWVYSNSVFYVDLYINKNKIVILIIKIDIR
jgi:hypothetical protein